MEAEGRLTEPELLDCYRRGVKALVHSWTALNLLISHKTGDNAVDGVTGEDKREWLIETLLEGGYTGRIQAGGQGDEASTAFVKTGDRDELADVILQIIQDEYETALEDDSDQEIAALIFRLRDELWPGGVVGVGQTVEGPVKTSFHLLTQLETKAESVMSQRKRSIIDNATEESDETDETDGEDEGQDGQGSAHGTASMEVDQSHSEVPRGPQFDDDGFQIVTRKK